MKGKLEVLIGKIYDFLIKNHLMVSKSQITEDFMLLYPGKELPQKIKDYYFEKIRMALYFLLGSGLMIALLWINEEKSQVIEDNLLFRNEYGGGEKEVELWVMEENREVPITVTLEERELKKEELDEIYPEFETKLDISMLGDNVSLEQISYDLNLVNEIEGYPFYIDWYTDGIYLDQNGHLLQEGVEKGCICEVRAQICYRDFVWEKAYSCHLKKPAVQEAFVKQLTDYLQEQEEQSRTERTIELPRIFQEQSVSFRKKETRQSILFLLGVPVLLIILSFCKDYDVHEMVKKRQEELEYDYPEVVNKLALYIGAGMTVPNAWNRVTKEYQSRKKTKRYVYEEMIYASREIDNGISFERALEGFGRRCQSAKYVKLVTLLSQYMKKGSAQIGTLLRQESREAMEERKTIIRKKGEKAGTKLLLPMMLLLGIVMILVVAPAFMNQLTVY